MPYTKSDNPIGTLGVGLSMIGAILKYLPEPSFMTRKLTDAEKNSLRRKSCRYNVVCEKDCSLCEDYTYDAEAARVMDDRITEERKTLEAKQIFLKLELPLMGKNRKDEKTEMAAEFCKAGYGSMLRTAMERWGMMKKDEGGNSNGTDR